MLFDLRGARRRRTIKVIYAGLAILLGGGLVLFGVGSDTQGGLFDAFKDDTQSDSEISKETRREIERLEKRVLVTPKNAQAWAQLADARFTLANQEGYDENASAQFGIAVYTSEGKRLLRPVDQAWRRYLALDPEQPDEDLAQTMTQVYDVGGLNNAGQAVIAQELVIDAGEGDTNEQRSRQFVRLALFAYQAKQNTKGDLAAKRAVALAPADVRSELRKDLEEQKTQIQSGQAQQDQQQQAQPSG